jgi:hypothetical protein
MTLSVRTKKPNAWCKPASSTLQIILNLAGSNLSRLPRFSRTHLWTLRQKRYHFPYPLGIPYDEFINLSKLISVTFKLWFTISRFFNIFLSVITPFCIIPLDLLGSVISLNKVFLCSKVKHFKHQKVETVCMEAIARTHMPALVDCSSQH